jgi:ceramide glucosyltransferase
MTYAADVVVVLAFVAAGYWAWAAYGAHAFGRRRTVQSGFAPSVSVLKPLCGVQAGLYETLRSFCEQAYPSFQLVFGTNDPADPAVDVVRRLIDEFPGLDMVLVCDGHVLGTNPKLSNVVNLYKSARHDVIVLADSDVQVGPDYLRTVVAPLADSGTGLVTCLYGAVPMPGLPSVLGAMYVNDWFFPSALVAERMRPLAYAFGATIACRRDVLDALGGFESVVDYLADDYMLGRAVAESGRRVELSPLVVQTVVHERDFSTLISHELRWARTIRSVRPVGYLLSCITFGFPLSLLALACGGATPVTMAALAANLVARLIGWHATRRTAGLPLRISDACLLPVRDVLSLGIWLVSFCGRAVRWYGQSFTIDSRGRLRRTAS